MKQIFRLGICLPSVCSTVQITQMMPVLAPNMRMTFRKVLRKVDDTTSMIDENLKKQVDQLLIGIFVVMFLSSVYDLKQKFGNAEGELRSN